MRQNFALGVKALDEGTDAVIASVSVLSFNDTAILGSLHFLLNIEDQIARGRSLHSRSMYAWAKEMSERASLAFDAAYISVEEGLDRITAFTSPAYQQQGFSNLWVPEGQFFGALLKELATDFGDPSFLKGVRLGDAFGLEARGLVGLGGLANPSVKQAYETMCKVQGALQNVKIPTVDKFIVA